jgi:hypothetical protein
VRGATIAVLAVPVTFVALVVTGLLVGWPIAAWHAAFVAGMVVTLVELTWRRWIAYRSRARMPPATVC